MTGTGGRREMSSRWNDGLLKNSVRLNGKRSMLGKMSRDKKVPHCMDGSGYGSEGERGIALIAALIVVFLASAAAVSMAERQLFEVRRTENLQRLDEAMLAVQGVEAWAAGALQADALAGATDHLNEPWALALPPTQIGGGRVSAGIMDAGGCFNLNNLLNGSEVSAIDRDRFERLLRSLDIDETVAVRLANAIQDWLDPDLNTTVPGGAEDDYYSRMDPPYRSANRPFAALSELRSVNGIDDDIYRRLRPHVCALPAHSDINVNTADVPVLMSIAEGMSQSVSERIVAARRREPFTEVGDFVRVLAQAGVSVNVEGLAVGSQYFDVLGHIVVGEVTMKTHTMFSRAPGSQPRILARRIGDDDDG